jgi:signal transduction histidine kinase
VPAGSARPQAVTRQLGVHPVPNAGDQFHNSCSHRCAGFRVPVSELGGESLKRDEPRQQRRPCTGDLRARGRTADVRAIMTRSQPRRLAAWVVGLGVVAFGNLGYVLNGWERFGVPDVTLPLDIGVGLSSVVAGLLVWGRHPRNRIGPLLYLMGVAWAVGGLWSLGYSPASATPWWTMAWWARLAIAAGYANTAFLVHVIFAYPSGHLSSRGSRVAVAVGYGVLAIQAGASLLGQPQPEPLTTSLYLALALAGVVTLSQRWYRAGHAARRVYGPVLVAGWLVATSGLLMEALVLVTGGERWANLGFIGALLLLPIGFLAGMMLGRLDRSEIADLVVALGQIEPGRSLRDVLAKALHDPSLQVAYWIPESKGFIDALGEPVDVAAESPLRGVTMIKSHDEDLAAIVHDPALRDDPQRLEASISAARMAIERERLAAQVQAQLEEVRASRARIVEAGDAARRQVERDLHDGAQQRLVALAMQLELVKENTSGASDLLDKATKELHAAIREIRDLARGVHPTILSEAGLGAAVEALAERAPFPVKIEASGARYGPSVETAAYFVVAEALTNVARHADATEARVGIVEDHDRLIVTITDDGRGGASPALGSGLRGIADRVAAADGTLMVTSPPDGGTTLRADLPLNDAPPANS